MTTFQALKQLVRAIGCDLRIEKPGIYGDLDYVVFDQHNAEMVRYEHEADVLNFFVCAFGSHPAYKTARRRYDKAMKTAEAA